MPTYQYKCSHCSKDTDIFTRISDRDMTADMISSQCKSKGTLRRQVSSALVGYHTYVNGAGKPPEGFRDLLRNMHNTVPGSQLDKTSSFL